MNGFAYCERDGWGFWSEPLNAVSNGAFVLAALAGLMLWRRAGGRDGPVACLIALVAAIAVGSFLFHTMPNRATLLADVVPIQLFAFGYFGLALRRLIGMGLVASGLGTAAFVAAAWGLSAGLAPLLPEGARGSAGYAAFALALYGVGLALRMLDGADRRAWLLLGAGLVFTLSLVARSLDQPLCGLLPFGLHWAWHLLNAFVLFMLLRAILMPAPHASR